MISTYKKKILKEIEDLPEDKMPKFYKIVHLLTTELIIEKKTQKKRGSLKGIWKGSQVDDLLFTKAKKSLFPYE